MVANRSWTFLGICVLFGAATARPCWAQWTAVNLHPPGFFRSKVLAVGPGVQAGFADTLSPSAGYASVWNGSAQSWASFNAPGVNSGVIEGIFGDSFVGETSVGGAGHAVIWLGSPTSLVDLNPGPNAGSAALAVHGNQQVGTWVSFTTSTHAALWRGTAASMVDLHPAGMDSSYANATDGTLQGGRVVVPSGFSHAALWSGSAAGFVDMNPPGSFTGSQIRGMAPGQQVGDANFGTGPRAILWHGSPQDFMDLNPPGAGVSALYATNGTAQVGSANLFASGGTAGIWFGTPESFIPLAPYLPPGYGGSLATSVAEANGTYYVGGYATNVQTGQAEAFLWVGVPAPGAGVVLLIAAALLRPRSRRSRR